MWKQSNEERKVYEKEAKDLNSKGLVDPMATIQSQRKNLMV
jgi:hypothetical protein